MNPKTPVPLLGYGSLMSGFGLERLGQLRARRVRRCEIGNGRRGFGKASIHGDRFAMVLELADPSRPIEARPLAPDQVGGPSQGILFDLALNDILSVCPREGYPAGAFRRLATLAFSDGFSIGSFLYDVARRADHDLATYRAHLNELLHYTSPHYIPHPVLIPGEEPGVTFLPPGHEGSGDAGVVPVRVASGISEVLSMSDTWRRKANGPQLEYFAMCFLAGEHGVRIDDIASGLDRAPDLYRQLRIFTASHAPREIERLRGVLGISPAQYRAFAGEPTDLYSLATTT